MAVKRRFADIDLSRLPDLPTPLDFDAVLDARIVEVTARLNAAGIPYDVGTAIKGDTVALLQRSGAYRETLTRQAVDDAVRSVLIATAVAGALDHLGATQVPPVERLPLVASPRDYATNPEDWEADADFRDRIQLAPESLSTCGPTGAYLSFAVGVDGVKGAQVYGPMSFGGTASAPFVPPGEVRVPIVAVSDDPVVQDPDAPVDVTAPNDGAASAALVATVQAALSADNRRPLADFVTVSAAEIVRYRIEAVLYVGPGADRDVVRRAGERRLLAQAKRQHNAGAAMLRQMLYGAAYVPDATGAIIVEEVDLIAPAGDVNADPIAAGSPSAAFRAPYCTDITVRVEVVDG